MNNLLKPFSLQCNPLYQRIPGSFIEWRVKYYPLKLFITTISKLVHNFTLDVTRIFMLPDNTMYLNNINNI